MDTKEDIRLRITEAIMRGDVIAIRNYWHLLTPRQRTDPYYTVMAIASGNITSLNCVHLGGGKWDETTYVIAARLGKLNVIKHLRMSDVPWDARTAFCATEFGQFDVLEWVLQNGCPCDKYSLLIYAVQYEQMRIVGWLLQNYTCYTPRALEVAYISGNSFIFDCLADYVERHY